MGRKLHFTSANGLVTVTGVFSDEEAMRKGLVNSINKQDITMQLVDDSETIIEFTGHIVKMYMDDPDYLKPFTAVIQRSST